METVFEYISSHLNVQELLVYNSTETARILLKLFLHYRYDVKHILKIGLQYDVAKSAEPTLFRSNTTGIDLVLDYVKSINYKLYPLCKLLIDKVCKYDKCIEINRYFIGKKDKQSENVKNLVPLLDSCLNILSEGFHSLSTEFGKILRLIATETNKRYETSGLKFVTTVFFLRIFCPILSMPQNYFLDIKISDLEQRNLIIVSKLLQSMASACTDVKQLEEYVKYKALIMHNCIASLIFRSDDSPICNWIRLENEELIKLENIIGLVLSEKLQLLDADGNYQTLDSPDVKHKLKTNFYKPVKINSIRSLGDFVSGCVGMGGDTSPKNLNAADKDDVKLEEELPVSSDYAEEISPKTSPNITSFKLDLSSLRDKSNMGKDVIDTRVIKLLSGSAEHHKSGRSIERNCDQKDKSSINRIPTYRRLKSSMTHNLISTRQKYEKITELDINHLTNREILILRIMLTSTDIYIKGLTSLSSEKLTLYKSRLLNDNAIIWTNRYLNNWIKKEIINFDINEITKEEVAEFIQVWKLDGWSFIQLDTDQFNYMKATSNIKLIIIKLQDKLKSDAIFTIKDFYENKGKVVTWSNDDVIMWLLLCNMEKYVCTFRELYINGSDLFNVSPDYLRFLGVNLIKDHMKIISLR